MHWQHVINFNSVRFITRFVDRRVNCADAVKKDSSLAGSADSAGCQRDRIKINAGLISSLIHRPTTDRSSSSSSSSDRVMLQSHYQRRFFEITVKWNRLPHSFSSSFPPSLFLQYQRIRGFFARMRYINSLLTLTFWSTHSSLVAPFLLAF